MIFRNSMLSIFRSMGKTALFTLLIFALTLVLTLGVSVWKSVEQFLVECNEYFTTVGLIEYMGTVYPSDTADDPGMAEAINSFDFEQITNDEATLLWDESTRAFGYIDGFWRNDKYMPSRMNSVFVIGLVNYHEYLGLYSAIVLDSLYSVRGRPDTIIYLDEDFGTFEKKHYYLVFGELHPNRAPLLNLSRGEFDNAIADSLGIKISHMQDITSEDPDELYRIPDNSVFSQVADTLQVTNNSVLVTETNDLMSLLPFHQQELYINEGRAFTQEEYENDEKVIVISEIIAARLGIRVGDTLNLSISKSDESGIYNSFWADHGFVYEDKYTIVGITNIVMDKGWYVYIPNSAEVPSSSFPIGYTVGYAIIDNESVAAFKSRVESSLEGRLELTIYDQGYSNVAIPFNTILSVSKIVTVVCLLVELAVMILFGFLFVYRQRETSEIMMALGAGKARIVSYFIFSAGLISLIATSTGAYAGYLLHDGIILMVAKAAETITLIDPRFSNANLAISRTLEFRPHLELQLFQYVGAIVFALAIIAILVFTGSTFINRRPSQQSQNGPKKERKTSQIGGGSSKYAILSILRGGARTIVVPILAMVVVIFFGQLTTTSLRYDQQLNSIHDNTTITGNYTAIKGKQINGLHINAFNIFNLYRSGQIDELVVSDNKPYYFLGTSILADGTSLDVPPLFVPPGFQAARRESEIQNGPDLVAVNDLNTSPEFHYADSIVLNFMDGYDESFLATPFDEIRTFTCLVPTSLMEENSIVFGDTIRVAVNEIVASPDHNYEMIYKHYDLVVIGSYEKQGLEDTIYVPLSLFFDTSLLWDAGQNAEGPPTRTFETGYTISDAQKDLIPPFTFNSTHFTLSDTHSLISFKEYLTDYGYSQANKISKLREFIVLKDASFNESVASVKQQINYINTLYPFLYVLVGVIAIVVSYLMVVSRKLEFAIMRGLGTTRIHSFLSFFTEQSILTILGILIGFSIWIPVWGTPTTLHGALSAGFFVCYLLGSAISVTIMSHSNVLTILTDKD